MTENEISRILKNSVPGEPAMAELGDAVRSGHRRRRTRVGSAAAVGLVALGIPVALQLGSLGNPQVLATPSPTPTVVTTEPVETRPPSVEPTPSGPGTPAVATLPDTDRLNSAVCEDAQGTVSEFPDALIPEGVAMLHLCSNDQEAAVPVFGAPEPILGDFSELIASVNDAPSMTGPTPCETEGDGRFGYIVVLEYPDGEKLVINTSVVDCLRVVDDGAQTGRGNGEAFFAGVLELLETQRRTHDYSYVNESAPCLEAESIVVRTIAGMVRGAACGVEPTATSPDDGQLLAHHLPADVVERVVEEATANAEPAPAHGLPLFSQTLVLQTRHGDPLTMYRWPDGSFYYQEEGRWMAWMPSAALAQELGFYFEGTRAETFPEPLPPELCMDPDMLLFEGPLSDGVTAEACVLVGDAVYEMHGMPPAVWDGFVADIEGASMEIAWDTDLAFTGHWLAVVNDEGRARQLFVTTDGDLVWDDPDNFDIRYQATPSQPVVDWMRSAGIQV